jgi:hypothetical protein
MLNPRFDLPQVGSLTHEARALRQCGKEMAIMGAKVSEEVFIGRELEIFAANLHRDDLFVGQFRGKAAPSYPLLPNNLGVLLDYQTVNGNDKSIAIHWMPPQIA